MFEMTYESEFGKAVLGGRDHKLAVLKDTLTGLGPPNRSYTVKKYIDIPGQFTTDEYIEARTITFSFDLNTEKDLIERETEKIYRIFSRPGIFTVKSGHKNKKINVQQNRISSPTQSNSPYKTFVCQMVCDDPYFSDQSSVRTTCFDIVNNITCNEGVWNFGSADSPVVWTSSNSDKVIVNNSDAETEPKFVISINGNSSSDAGFEILKLSLLDGSILETLYVHKEFMNGEQITINCNSRDENGRYIISSLNGDISEYCSKDSVLADFKLSIGNNRIVFHSLDDSVVVKAYMEYDNKYVTGV